MSGENEHASDLQIPCNVTWLAEISTFAQSKQSSLLHFRDRSMMKTGNSESISTDRERRLHRKSEDTSLSIAAELSNARCTPYVASYPRACDGEIREQDPQLKRVARTERLPD